MEFTAAQDGLRVDVFLAGCLPELTRSAVQRLLAEGGVTCGGAPAGVIIKSCQKSGMHSALWQLLFFIV